MQCKPWKNLLVSFELEKHFIQVIWKAIKKYYVIKTIIIIYNLVITLFLKVTSSFRGIFMDIIIDMHYS